MNKKILKSFFFSFMILGTFLFVATTHAQSINLQVPVLNLSKVNNLGEYLTALFNFSVVAVGIIAVVMIMVGGFMYVAAAGDAGKIGTAKGYITSAIIGLLLVFTSYIILNEINPATLKLDLPQVTKITAKDATAPPGCCLIKKEWDDCFSDKTYTAAERDTACKSKITPLFTPPETFQYNVVDGKCCYSRKTNWGQCRSTFDTTECLEYGQSITTKPLTFQYSFTEKEQCKGTERAGFRCIISDVITDRTKIAEIDKDIEDLRYWMKRIMDSNAYKKKSRYASEFDTSTDALIKKILEKYKITITKPTNSFESGKTVRWGELTIIKLLEKKGVYVN